ncbi:MAG: hypothetical protein K9H25_20455 [Rhodospirillum sp.]|nr:hypothetical protein [Rhodospirillum sp.]MCF8491522.1 hypothetical protein [Rhodospirillum sp.]MCF8502149.1 hypothetical protein [Rhodospirillum sp.]
MTVEQAARVLRGLGRVLRLNPLGFKEFENTPGEALRSFQAALWLAPVFVLYAAMDRFTGDEASGPLGAFAVLKAAHYVIGWTLFPVVMEGISRLLGRRQVYFRWLAAYNWLQVPIMLAYLPVAVASLLGAGGPGGPVAFLDLALFLGMATYLGFLARHGLGLPLSSAVAVVVLDLILTQVAAAVVHSVLMGAEFTSSSL